MHPLIERAKREGRHLLESEALGVLIDHGIAVPPHRLARSEQEAVNGATELGWPVVMKVVARDIVHKSEWGGVALNLRDEGAVREAFARLTSIEAPGSRVPGVILYPFQENGVEVFAGMVRDSQFGPVITFGLGGIWVEALRDVAYGIAPLSMEEVEEMVHSIKGHLLLEGARGRSPVDRQALYDLLVRLSHMALEEEALQEVDLNPIFLFERGLFIADARMLLA